MSVQQQRRKQILNSMKRLAEQSESTTIQTNAQLSRQGQKLDRIQDTTNKLDKQTDKTKKLSRQIYSFFYYIKDKIAGDKSKAQSNDMNEKSQPQKIQKNQVAQKANMKLTAQSQSKQETEDETLDMLYEKMKGVKKMQKQMGEQIDRHIVQIDKNNNKMDKINVKIEESNKMLKQKLNK